MDFSSSLTRQLDALSAALDGSGDDLTTILNLLIQDLTATITSFVGLIVTVAVDSDPITLIAMNSHTAATSMLLPLTTATGSPDEKMPGHAVLYAQTPGAFAGLAADTRTASNGNAVHVVLDEHLPPPTARDAELSIRSLQQRSLINQAVGVLIEHGYAPSRARAELRMRAAAAGVTTSQIAESILNQLRAGSHDSRNAGRQVDHPLDNTDGEDDPDERVG